jgi:ABC transporter substrate binding protein (PQQ-dependent alcohol dehydrogenase system)
MRILLALLCLWPISAPAAEVTLAYVKIARAAAPTLSNLDPVPDDLGQAGARLAIDDNNTTGKFIGQSYDLRMVDAPEDIGDAQFVILDTPDADQIEIADAFPDKVFFNVASYADDLRAENCRKNLFHTLPSYGMRADALMQFTLKKRWTRLALIKGHEAEDQAFALAIEAAATKFQLNISASEDWIYDEDMRRSASSEVPLFTQKLGDYDLLVIADERNDFARYIAYNTWLPRPFAGAEGLQAVGWGRVMEQWGAAQLQSRFADLAGRDMQDVDYAAWVAVRAVGEAMTRTKNAADVRTYLLSDAFELAGYKGAPMSFRNWDGQMRQPIGLVHGGAVVTMAPLEEFLHQRNPLDSLGIDQPQSHCKEFVN